MSGFLGIGGAAAATPTIIPSGLALAGYADFNNNLPVQTLNPGAWEDLRNDKAGANTIIDKMPVGVAIDVSLATGRISFTGLALDDQVFIRHEFVITPQTNNQTFTFKNDVGTVAYPIGTHSQKMEGGGNTPTETINPFSWVYLGDANTLNGGVLPRLRTTGPGVVQYNGCAISIFKRYT